VVLFSVVLVTVDDVEVVVGAGEVVDVVEEVVVVGAVSLCCKPLLPNNPFDHFTKFLGHFTFL
jgi:hypothetical protein